MTRRLEEVEREIRSEYEERYAGRKKAWEDVQRRRSQGWYVFDYGGDPDSPQEKQIREVEMNSKIRLAIDMNRLGYELTEEMWDAYTAGPHQYHRLGPGLVCPVCHAVFLDHVYDRNGNVVPGVPSIDQFEAHKLTRHERATARDESKDGCDSAGDGYYDDDDGSPAHDYDNDNHSDQMNPNNDEYWHSRGN